MKSHKNTLGRRGEDLAVNALEKQGYSILERNYRIRLGEIDIIAQDAGTICFIEVKTRKTLKQGAPYEAVSKSKQYKLSQLALCFLKTRRLIHKKARFDVVSIQINSEGEGSVEVIRNAFELDPRYSY